MSEVFKTKAGWIAHLPPRHKDRLGLPCEDGTLRQHRPARGRDQRPCWSGEVRYTADRDGQHYLKRQRTECRVLDRVLSRAYLVPHRPTANP